VSDPGFDVDDVMGPKKVDVTKPLRIGLLKADWVNPDLLQHHGDLPDMFRRFFEAGGEDVKLDVFDVIHGVFPPATYACDAFVITGSRFSAYDTSPAISAIKSFIRSAGERGAKFIGICFGHQILAEALGGRVQRATWNVGLGSMSIREQEGWMRPFRPTINLLFNHRDRVVEPPPRSRVLATAGSCAIAMFVRDQQYLGIQAHPEYTTAYQESLMNASDSLPATQRVEATDRNRALRFDSQETCFWLLNFIRVGSAPANAMGGSR
jgi:GMP synthase-like glutamine amidotransferase